MDPQRRPPPYLAKHTDPRDANAMAAVGRSTTPPRQIIATIPAPPRTAAQPQALAQPAAPAPRPAPGVQPVQAAPRAPGPLQPGMRPAPQAAQRPAQPAQQPPRPPQIAPHAAPQAQAPNPYARAATQNPSLHVQGRPPQPAMRPPQPAVGQARPIPNQTPNQKPNPMPPRAPLPQAQGMAPRPGMPSPNGGAMNGAPRPGLKPSARVDDMMQVIRQLCDLLTKENAALRKHRTEEVKAFTERKEQLARLYQGHMNAVHRDKNLLKDLDPARRAAVTQQAMHLGNLMQENAALLKGNIQSINLFFKAVTDAVRERQERTSAAYSRRGAMNGYIAKRSLAVSFNQTM